MENLEYNLENMLDDETLYVYNEDGIEFVKVKKYNDEFEVYEIPESKGVPYLHYVGSSIDEVIDTIKTIKYFSWI